MKTRLSAADRVAQIRARINAATSGPWRADDEHGDMPGVTPAWCVSRTDVDGKFLGDVAYVPNTRRGLAEADTIFIAEARQDVVDLTEAVDAILNLKREGSFSDHAGAGYDMALKDIRDLIEWKLGVTR